MLVICTAIARRACSVLGWLLMVLVLLYFVRYEALWRRAQLCSEPTRGRQPDRHPRRRRGMLLLLTFKQSILLSTHPLTLSLPSHPLTRSPYCAVLCCLYCVVTPAQPSQAQPSPAQPSPAQPSPAQPSSCYSPTPTHDPIVSHPIPSRSAPLPMAPGRQCQPTPQLPSDSFAAGPEASVPLLRYHRCSGFRARRRSHQWPCPACRAVHRLWQISASACSKLRRLPHVP